MGAGEELEECLEEAGGVTEGRTQGFRVWGLGFTFFWGGGGGGLFYT